MTETPQPATSVTDADLVAIFRSRDWARVTIGRIKQEGLNEYHTAHSLISESVALMFGLDIEVSRAFTNEIANQLLAKIKAVREDMFAAIQAATKSAPDAAAIGPSLITEPTTEPDANVVNFARKDPT